MPPHRILPLVFAVAAGLSILTTLAGLGGELSTAAGVVALLAVAAYVVLRVERPVARWALSAGTVALAAVPLVGRVAAPGPASFGLARAGLGTIFQERADAVFASTVLLLVAAAAVALGVVALPQFRRPAWPTALACLVALLPVAAVGRGAAGALGLPLSEDPDLAGLAGQLAPAAAATVLAGLALVLAVSRAERWFLLPAGALLLQVTTADRAEDAAGAWRLARAFGGARGVETGSAFLQPGLRTDTSLAATVSVDWAPGAALATAALLLAPALLAAGAARTGGPTGPGPAEPPGPR